MRYLRTKSYMTKQCLTSRFQIASFNPGMLLTIAEETSDKIIATYGGDSYEFTPADPVEIYIKEVPALVYELWYEGVKTSHTFEVHSVPDIRTLGFDVNKPHEFKIKMVIT